MIQQPAVAPSVSVPGAESVLVAKHLVKIYGDRKVVNDVSFHVNESEIVGLLGRNGAGKTTSFRMAIGMITPDGGNVTFNNQDITTLPMYQRAQRGMGYLAQDRSIFRNLSVEDNLFAILETRPLNKAQRRARADELLAQFALTHVRKNLARVCSGGEQRKLEIARALICEPVLMLLDEPFSNIDPVAVEDLQREIRRLRDAHKIAMLVTDHNVQRTLEICDRAYVIFEGKVFAHGTPREIINNDEVRKLYLGSTFKGDEFDT
jgi:lipopolysaccharide export system ATP-binding protein